MRLQVNEQKEQKVLEMVLKTAPFGDPQAVLDAIDNYGWSTGFLMNIGDRKGAVMEAALHRCQPKVCCKVQFYQHPQQLSATLNKWLDRCLAYMLLLPVRLLAASALKCVLTPEDKHVTSYALAQEVIPECS